jgi:hypothetical protein
VLSAVGGDKLQVTLIIHDPSADPHSYHSTAEDALAAQNAKILLGNGGGYDNFFTKLSDQAPGAKKLSRLRHRRDGRPERARLVQPAQRREGRRLGRHAARRPSARLEAGLPRQHDGLQDQGRRANQEGHSAWRRPPWYEGGESGARPASPVPLG